MDLTAFDAIDVHVHVEQDGHGCYSLDQELLDASAKYFRANADRPPTVAAIAELYRAHRTAAVVFTVDAPAGTGHPPLSSEEIAEAAAEHANVLIPFGSVDPHAGKAAVARARRLVTEHGVRGFKFHLGRPNEHHQPQRRLASGHRTASDSPAEGCVRRSSAGVPQSVR
nr:amidohydrolase family protein [Nonomuraea lactucae]